DNPAGAGEWLPFVFQKDAKQEHKARKEHENREKSTKSAPTHPFVHFALSILRVSKGDVP
ncbi:MAG: hypothetical protein KAW49_13545, partial [Anaerolineae bacterium]|nr:hypothetical protein [Anaerolineae bacterium]